MINDHKAYGNSKNELSAKQKMIIIDLCKFCSIRQSIPKMERVSQPDRGQQIMTPTHIVSDY